MLTQCWVQPWVNIDVSIAAMYERMIWHYLLTGKLSTYCTVLRCHKCLTGTQHLEAYQFRPYDTFGPIYPLLGTTCRPFLLLYQHILHISHCTIYILFIYKLHIVLLSLHTSVYSSLYIVPVTVCTVHSGLFCFYYYNIIYRLYKCWFLQHLHAGLAYISLFVCIHMPEFFLPKSSFGHKHSRLVIESQ